MLNVFLCAYLASVLYVFLVKCLFRSLHIFRVGLVAFLLNFKSSLYILAISPLKDVFYNYFLSVFGLLFHSHNRIFGKTEVFHFSEAHFISFFFSCFLSCIKNCKSQGHKSFLLSSRTSIVLGFTFRFELIFI